MLCIGRCKWSKKLNNGDLTKLIVMSFQALDSRKYVGALLNSHLGPSMCSVHVIFLIGIVGRYYIGVEYSTQLSLILSGMVATP